MQADGLLPGSFSMLAHNTVCLVHIYEKTIESILICPDAFYRFDLVSQTVLLFKVSVEIMPYQ